MLAFDADFGSQQLQMIGHSRSRYLQMSLQSTAAALVFHGGVLALLQLKYLSKLERPLSTADSTV